MNKIKEIIKEFINWANKYKKEQYNSMKLLGFNSFSEFSNQLDVDPAFRQFIYDFLKEKLVE